MIKEFKKFLIHGNLVDLAIGFTVGSAFSTVAKSLVTDIIMPPISVLLGSANFDNFYFVIKNGNPSGPYESLSEAVNANAATLNIGTFVNNVFSLFIVAVAMFFVIKTINKFDSEIQVITGKKDDAKKSDPTFKKCPFCLTNIPYRASKCSACTSDQPKAKKS
ncbi:large conductance mechanosensitive channel protein MscL [Candidatus Woesebacteria bacterium]|nr:MAG: large conductance mechanosensitive channel protein MscL [Candidatus Woesebacteria bacterium]